jgi:DNA mismatch repair ATPase MutS
LNAIGIVATHDLGVCDLANTFPGTMTNKRFEVEMEGEELHFDYKLRNGICENKNASVILRKSGII